MPAPDLFDEQNLYRAISYKMSILFVQKKKKLKPLPVETRPAAEANAALEDLKAGRVVGRVVLNFETVQ